MARRPSLPLALLLALVFSSPAGAVVVRDLDFQTPGLLRSTGKPFQWENYVPGKDRGTSGITLGSPGKLPYPYTKAANFKAAPIPGRPRSMAKLAKHSTADPGVRLNEPLDAAEGLDRYYLWQHYLPSKFVLPNEPKLAPAVLVAWHNDSSKSLCNPNIQMHVKRVRPGRKGQRVLLKIQGGRHSKTPPTTFRAEGGTGPACYTETYKEIDLGPATTKRWVLWQLHIRWSSNPAKGLIEIRRNGRMTRIPGANLYRSPTGEPEKGFLEVGYYSPVDTTQAARERSVWQVGWKIATAASDIVPEVLCRRLSKASRRVSVGGRRYTVALDRRSTSEKPARVRIVGKRGGLRRASATLDGQRIRFRKGAARLPKRAFERRGRHRLVVELTRRNGASRTVTLRVRARGCGGGATADAATREPKSSGGGRDKPCPKAMSAGLPLTLL